MGLYLNLASVVSAVCDNTGDSTEDAQVKIRRLVNEKGHGFCAITNWPFLKEDISFSLSTSSATYSGADYLPLSFAGFIAAHLEDNNGEWFPLHEVSVRERYERWLNPNSNNQGRPSEFCVTRIEDGYYQIAFNRLPDDSYTFKADIKKKWVNATSTTASLVVTDDYTETFCHFISMARARQQPDLELLATLKEEWWNPNDSAGTVLGRALASIKSSRQTQITPSVEPPDQNDYKGDINV